MWKLLLLFGVVAPLLALAMIWGWGGFVASGWRGVRRFFAERQGTSNARKAEKKATGLDALAQANAELKRRYLQSEEYGTWLATQRALADGKDVLPAAVEQARASLDRLRSELGITEEG